MERSSAVLGPSFACALLGVAGCTSFITPHQVYAPLLDHAGQVDISARGGLGVPGAAGVSANVAYAPVDSFEIVAGADFNLGNEARHYAGQLAVGTFVREDVFRLEALAGTYAGYAEGFATGTCPGCSLGFASYRLEGPYLMPYGQVLIGFEGHRVEFAGGFRLYGSFADVTSSPSAGGPPRVPPRGGYERMYVEPVVTLRINIDFVRVDLMTAVPINIAGASENAPLDLVAESYDVMWYFAVGVGFQIDTIEQPAAPEESYLEPAPGYAPAPPSAVYTPAPPPTYVPVPPPAAPAEPGSIISPLPPPPAAPPTGAPPPG